jgi:hypothetical protein
MKGGGGGAYGESSGEELEEKTEDDTDEEVLDPLRRTPGQARRYQIATPSAHAAPSGYGGWWSDENSSREGRRAGGQRTAKLLPHLTHVAKPRKVLCGAVGA